MVTVVQVHVEVAKTELIQALSSPLSSYSPPHSPGFIVMKMPTDLLSLMFLPSKTNLAVCCDRACRMDRICWATTDSTSMLIRLNSSKQPHAPDWGMGGGTKSLRHLMKYSGSSL